MCGIVGILDKDRAVATDLYVSLGELQHRGKESAAMAVSALGLETTWVGGEGEVPIVFRSAALKELVGGVGVGHVRYGTAGTGTKSNIQPIRGVFRNQDFYLAHNGNLINATTVCQKYNLERGYSDTRVIVHVLSLSSAATFEDALVWTLRQLEGSFNLVILFNNRLYAVKDRFGFHPLQFGLDKRRLVVASESCVFDALGLEGFRDILPGQLLIADKDGTTLMWWAEERFKFDLFEFIYFLRPDSTIHGVEAGRARWRMGKALAGEHPFNADIVIPVPDSGNQAAHGYADGLRQQGAKMEFEPWALFRRHGVSRTFIEPLQEQRLEYLHLKFNPRKRLFAGKRVVLVDDSLVRGNTATRLVQFVRAAGAKEVFLAVASPMYRYPDFYGIDTYRVRGELIARNLNGDTAAVASRLGLDGLGYLSLDSTIQAVLDEASYLPAEQALDPLVAERRHQQKEAVLGVSLTKDTFYTGPFTGEYPAGTGEFTVD